MSASLNDSVIDEAVNKKRPVQWLLDYMDKQGHQPSLDPLAIIRMWHIERHNSQLIRSYQPRPYDEAITLFCTEKSAPKDGPQRWQALTPKPVNTIWISGEHDTMLNVEHVERLGRALAARLGAIGS